jgi:hypothetical protein
METVHMRAHTTSQGRLLLDLHTSLEDSDVDVTVTVQSPNEMPRDSLGWPIGFWQRFAGSMPDFPDIEDVAPEEVEPLR